MSDTTPRPPDDLANASREEIMAALFANMVIQQTNMAMMLLGKVPHPETGKHIQDFEAARMFIDQLEMLEVKTKGNLSREEDALLKQALMALRMAFVEAVEPPAEAGASPTDRMAGQSAAKPVEPPASEAATQPPPSQPATPPVESSPAAAADESRKKFSKKY